jgi:uncharacterized membrane protein
MPSDRNSTSNEASEPILKNIEAILDLEAQHERKIPAHQRFLERIAANFGETQFLYGMVIFFVSWQLATYLSGLGFVTWYLPKFDLEQDWLDLTSLLISTGVLVSQTRQGKLSERRSHLVLQLNILTEQKITKLIALIEELRTDLPNVHNRYDSEAEMMKQVIDPLVVLDVLHDAMNNDTVSKTNDKASDESEPSNMEL